MTVEEIFKLPDIIDIEKKSLMHKEILKLDVAMKIAMLL